MRGSNRPPGSIAEEALLRARLEAAKRARDPIAEREAAAKLARWFAGRDHDLDQAVGLAARALAIQDDSELRRELATWLEGLGDAAQAAEVLGPLAAGDDAVATNALLRVGTLCARAAEAGAAAAAFAKAARLDPADPLPCELRASLGGWAPETVSSELAADAYLEAAARRETSGAIDAQMDDLWRAVDADPTGGPPVEALAAALGARGKIAAADEVLRAHAEALRASDPERAKYVHQRRRDDAIVADDLPRALAAALDEGIDAELDGAQGAAFDDLLARAGLIEPLAVRLELRAERANANERGRVLEELGRLYAGPLATPDRAVDAFSAAMAIDPARTEALVALRSHAAQRRDPGPLVDALVRALSIEGAEAERARSARMACARTLVHVAEEQLADPALAAWAAERLLRLDPDDAQGRVSLARAEARRGTARERLEAARAAVARDGDAPAARIAALRALAAALRGVPLEGALRARVLAELAERAPEDRATVTEAYRAAWGRGDRFAARAIAEKQLASATETWQRVEARRQLAAEARARGAMRDAWAATQPLLDEAPEHRLAASLAWMHAVGAHDDAGRARALVAIAGACVPRVRAAILGVAASALHAAGDVAAARRVAEQGALADGGAARCLVALAESSRDRGASRVADGGPPDERSAREVASAYERAIGAVGSRPAWCATLAEALERAGDANYAVSWTQRLVALRPGDPASIEALVNRAVRARDAARLGDALTWTLSQAQPAGSLAAHVAGALPELSALDPERAAVIARRALDTFGPRHDALRDAMAGAADAARDDALAAALLERWIAIGAPAADRGALHAELVKHRARLGDRDGEARAIERAVRDGFDVRGFEANLDALAEARLSPDGEIAFLEARASLAVAKGETAVASATLRQLGASLWDLARDRAGAARAFVRAASITGHAAALGQDLARFGDPAFNLEVLLERLAQETVTERAGAIAAEAARAAYATGDPARAFDLAALALGKNPALADALAIAELGSVSSGRPNEMSPLYDAVGARALGRFGRRAAHYRAARFFEQRGDAGLALKHAAEAFAAVPSEGNGFVLLARAAARAQDPGVAIRTIERVASQSGSAPRRAAWLLRAATILGDDEESLAERFDVLLRAAVTSPEPATIALLTDCARDIVAKLPDEREGMQLRLGRAAHKMMSEAEGPEGARTAIALAYALVDGFGDVEDAGDLILRALAMDGDLDEYARLLPFALKLGASDGGAALLAQAMASADKPYANVGAPAWRLIAGIAEGAGNEGIHARATIDAALRDPEDDALVVAADAAIRASDDAALRDRLAKRVPMKRRVEALVATARAAIAERRFEDGIERMERAIESSDDAARAPLEIELRAACLAAGRVEHLEERALHAASDARLGARDRASKWADIAAERERRNDLAAAASALFEAAVLEPESVERWSALERVAAAARRHDLRAHALQEIAARVPEASRVDVLRRLARAHTEAFDSAAAESAWHEVWTADPEDEEADHAIEQLVVARGDYGALADHLGRRAERLALRSGNRDGLRAVRLRRAAILEQRLNRLEDACEELALLLTESPDNEHALSYLADLHERMGHGDRAAPLWRRAATITKDPSRAIDLLLRAAEASRAFGDLKAALAGARGVIARDPKHREALAMAVDIAQQLGDEGEVGVSLEQLAMAEDDSRTRADRLVEAAQAAARAQDAATAIARAQRAARIAPTRASAQLYARGLEYRVRGAGTPTEAQATIEELGRIEGQLVVDDAALQAFLLAEAFDAVQGGGAGLHRLIHTEKQIGAHALVSLGLAERYVAQWKFADALPHFHRALSGDVFGLRRRGRIALAAADAAMRVEDHEAAMKFLDVAAAEPDARPAALRKLAAIVTSRGDVARSRAVLLELARAANGDDRARTLAQLARVLLASGASEERREAIRLFDEAIDAAPAGMLRAQLENELASIKKRPSLFPAADAPPPTPPPASPPADLHALARAAEQATTPGERAKAQIAIAKAHADKGERAAAETSLWDALKEGSAEAGELLADMLAHESGRSADLLNVRRKLVDLAPGHFGRLEALRAAALADRDPIHARAIEHVLRAFDPGAGPLPPPALGGQSEHLGMLAHLLKPTADANVEPFTLAWEGAHALFAKTPIAYAITGVERITPGGASPLSRLFEAVIRVLGVPRVPLFHRRSAKPVEASVAITHPASALVTGDVHEETTELRWALGHALACALPQHVLLLGLPEAQARVVWGALLAAFGPPFGARGMDRDGAHLAESFWQTIPSRTQRRMQELLAHAAASDFDAAFGAAKQSARRVALFVAGDFGHAARALLRERGVDPKAAAGDGLRVLCGEHPALADLLRLAVSPEYADARWHPVSPASQRNPAPSTKGRALL